MLIRDFITGKIPVPTKSKMLKDSSNYISKLNNLEKFNFPQLMGYIRDYCLDLMAMVNYPKYDVARIA